MASPNPTIAELLKKLAEHEYEKHPGESMEAVTARLSQDMRACLQVVERMPAQASTWINMVQLAMRGLVHCAGNVSNRIDVHFLEVVAEEVSSIAYSEDA